jgi:hypothetical protein
MSRHVIWDETVHFCFVLLLQQVQLQQTQWHVIKRMLKENAQDGSKRSALYSSCFTPGKTPIIKWIGAWVGSDLDWAKMKRKIPVPTRKQIPTVQSTNHFTEWGSHS